MKRASNLFRLPFKWVVNSIIGKERAMHWLADDLDRSLLYLPTESYLEEVGWINSIGLNKSIDKNGNPVPWLTYPFVRFLKDKLRSDLLMVEYGSGSSTIYFSSKIDQVISFEDEITWFNQVRPQLGANAALHFYKSHDEIKAVLNNLKAKPGIILIDSLKDRLKFTELSLNYISDDGVIILDDTNEKEQAPIVELLFKHNYKKIDFWGLAPMIRYQKCTSLFYKKDNCLNI